MAAHLSSGTAKTIPEVGMCGTTVSIALSNRLDTFGPASTTFTIIRCIMGVPLSGKSGRGQVQQPSSSVWGETQLRKCGVSIPCSIMVRRGMLIKARLKSVL